MTVFQLCVLLFIYSQYLLTIDVITFISHNKQDSLVELVLRAGKFMNSKVTYMYFTCNIYVLTVIFNCVVQVTLIFNCVVQVTVIFNCVVQVTVIFNCVVQVTIVI